MNITNSVNAPINPAQTVRSYSVLIMRPSLHQYMVLLLPLDGKTSFEQLLELTCVEASLPDQVWDNRN